MFSLFLKYINCELTFNLLDNNKGSTNIVFNGTSYLINYPCTSTYDCTGYNVILPAGKYLFEVWGAQGGNGALVGGKGGYSYGEIILGESTNAYIHIGGQPSPLVTGVARNGGYNGGGSATIGANGNGGGGGTDIRLVTNDLYYRVIVGGAGGGGSSTSHSPGFGGGVEGGASSYGPVTNKGTQTSGGYGGYGTQGSFGLGGSHSGSSAGAGGGWYGGAPSENGGSNTGGGGGSGYVLTSTSHKPSGYMLSSSHYLLNAQMIAGSSTMPAPNGGTEVGHSGHGIARITVLSPLRTPDITPAKSPFPTSTLNILFTNGCLISSFNTPFIVFFTSIFAYLLISDSTPKTFSIIMD